MTTSPTLDRPYTADEYDAMHGRERYDLVAGRLVERHVSYLSSVVGMIIGRVLGNFVAERHLGTVFGADLGVRIHPNDPTHTRHADVGFVSAERAPADDTGYLRVAPALVVEVVSPGDTASEARAKVDEWLEHGVRMVWVVFPGAREVHVYSRDAHPQIVTGDDAIEAGSAVPGFSAPVDALFPPR